MQVNITDPGFLYGQGVFETMRTYNGKIFCLNDHLCRLAQGAKIIGLDLPVKNKLKTMVQAVISDKKAINSRIKIVSWQAGNKTKSIVVTSKLDALPQYFTATISSIRQNENSPLCNVKSLNYLNFLLAKKLAQKKKFDEAILLNSKCFLAEGSRSNIFFVNNNCLFTPSLDCGCLSGVTRKVVLEIASKYKIKIIQGRFKKENLFSSSEAFLTNSIFEIMPLVRINNQKIGNGKIGKLTKLLQEKYRLEIYKKCYN